MATKVFTMRLDDKLMAKVDEAHLLWDQAVPLNKGSRRIKPQPRLLRTKRSEFMRWLLSLGAQAVEAELRKG